MIHGARLAAFASLLPLAAIDAQANGAHTARIVGVIADSVSGAPLQGAEVVASGVGTPVKTDSLGRFTIDGLAPGTYQVGAYHPLLESLGISLATQPFAIGPDSAGVVNLAVPSVPTLVRRYCANERSSATPSAVVGRVLDPEDDAPVPGAKVSLAWTEIFVSKTTGVFRTPHELHAETNSSGFFKLCGLPADLEATLQGSRGEITSPEIPISMNGALLDFQSLSIPVRNEARATGIVTGRVLSPIGKPVSGAKLVIPMSAVTTTSRDDGTFRFNEVQTGTQMVVARSLSYAPAAEPVNVSSREPVDVTLHLAERVASLDTVFVTARRNAYLDKAGFNRRKLLGTGYFVTREDIDRRKPFAITDMVKDLPGVTVMHVRGGTVLTGRRVFGLSSDNGCSRVFVDGFELRSLQPGDFDSFVNSDDVVGMEIYQPANVPARFRSMPDCLTVVVWTQFRGKAAK